MTAPASSSAGLGARALRATLAAGAVLLVLDLLWLGVVARGFYAAELGELMAREVNGVAAALFYAMYVAAVVVHAALPAATPGMAARRGAALGLVAYATYELTNWAVIAGWPANLVLADILWGVVLTSVAAAAGRWGAGRPH